MGNTDQLEYRSAYNKVSPKTEVKSLEYVNNNKRFKRYKNLY